MLLVSMILGTLAGQQALDTGKAIVGQTGMYQAGFFPVMMFGLPAGAFAIYQCARPEKKKLQLH